MIQRRVGDFMYKLFNVTGGRGGDSHLVTGGEKTAIFDTGMAWCGLNVVDNIKETFRAEGSPGRRLDCVFLTHSHYDHLGALPLILREWPEAVVYGAPHARWVLSRPNAIKAIRKLNQGAAVLFNQGQMPEYDDGLLRIDKEVSQGQVVDLGDCPVETIETPGHTKCSLSFLVDGELMIASESTGYTSKMGRVNATYIIGHKDALASIRRCQELAPKKIVSPHYGLLDEAAARLYWAKCWNATCYSRDFILARAQSIREEGREPSVEEILEACYGEFYDEVCKYEQPYRAWRLNYSEAIRTVLREYPGGLVPPELAAQPRLTENTGMPESACPMESAGTAENARISQGSSFSGPKKASPVPEKSSREEDAMGGSDLKKSVLKKSVPEESVLKESVPEESVPEKCRPGKEAPHA
ncbi:MAG: MBL fold metallo-hydrolase [Peptococcaceae bacterium]|nr:MBL fold metallo-hydrolase [Peptococcaceae bacterium]